MLTHPGALHVWGEGDGVCEGKRERGYRGVQRMGTGIWCVPGRNDGFESVLRYSAAVRIGATVRRFCE